MSQPLGKTLMIQGTMSDAGKSLLTAGIGRALVRRGWRVVPFKAQNMALNSAVTPDGLEIGRAQALQAVACGLTPRVAMNPVLLKPCTDTGAQVIIHGRPIGNLEALAYHGYKPTALKAVLQAHAELAAEFDLVLAEGAGSPAEINLRQGDIANMGFAEAVDCPVLLAGDIDRGGVFAQIVGTFAVLPAEEQARIRGVIINKFRGDIALLQGGLDWLSERIERPVLGTLPYLMQLNLDAEDAIDAAQQLDCEQPLKVVVPVLPRISNHSDFDALRLHPQVDLQFVSAHQPPPAADLIILPGSKSVRADLATLRAAGWAEALQRHLRYGGKLLGICGGLQMLGQTLHDPAGIEGAAGSSPGLGLLALETTLEAEKILELTEGQLPDGSAVRGYEIHAGRSQGSDWQRGWITLADGRREGAISLDGQVAASYLHGLFDHPEALQSLLGWAGLSNAQTLDREQQREAALDQLADAIEAHLDLDAIEVIAGLR